MHARFLTTRLLAPALALLLTGCGLDSTALPGAEANDPDFVQGQQLDKEGRKQEALAAYLKEIERRGIDAPESHLDAGILYEQEFKDPIAAIYHYRKYLELQPRSPQAELARGRIEGALREFARTLPGDPMANAGGELGATVDRLQKENAQLRAQLAKLGGTAPAGTDPKLQPHGGTSSVKTTTQSGNGLLPVPDGVQLVPSDTLIHPAPPPPGSLAAKTYTVVAGDTLSVVAQKMYGNKSKWPDIQAANKDLLPTDKTPLKIGMELKIP